jgi:hypothetical protein
MCMRLTGQRRKEPVIFPENLALYNIKGEEPAEAS